MAAISLMRIAPIPQTRNISLSPPATAASLVALVAEISRAKPITVGIYEAQASAALRRKCLPPVSMKPPTLSASFSHGVLRPAEPLLREMRTSAAHAQDRRPSVPS